MTEARRSYKGFHIVLCVPDTVEPGKPCGRVELKAPDGGLGIRFTPDWPDRPENLKAAEEWLFAYAAGIVDCELAGGFGIDLHHD
ncbi:hypothetical protein [Cupriavidus alkaliphilus]|uniref:Uncharacterized protein n=1 Tax=Cupriavidus alkaliphilus TaxID=942866 RepID=A0A7W4VEB9_9BURK|nr:hypothetical protein [Cupriavidus alkaliphilus]MBB3010053.1 hypothetical protein [Cupriavidus alkaliphilus]